MKQDALIPLPPLAVLLLRNLQMVWIKALQLSHSCSFIPALSESQESSSHRSFHDLSNPGLLNINKPTLALCDSFSFPLPFSFPHLFSSFCLLSVLHSYLSCLSAPPRHLKCKRSDQQIFCFLLQLPIEGGGFLKG